MNLIKVFLWIGVVNLSIKFSWVDSYIFMLIIGSLLIFIVDHFSFSKKIFEKHKGAYKFIEEQRKAQRLAYFWIPFVISICICLGTAALNIKW